ncbi:MAG: hypothetical protein U1C46_04050 [Bacteroidales bacterium]|nr:hypothetical protein [Bacteroidales bacterium]MDZ4203975.1 hypothetical protein [Bacteroidales bacterium]
MRSALFIVCLFFFASVFAQERKPGHFEGRIIDLYNNTLEYAHVINLSRSYGVVADHNGRFIMPAFEGDSLMITHVSHITRFIRAELPTIAFPEPTEIVMLPKIFELKEFIVRYLPKTKMEFRHDFVQLKLPEATPAVDIRMPHIHTLVYLGPEHGLGVVIKGPFQALYDQFSREAKSKRKLESELAREVTRALVEHKYNHQLISSLTGLRDHDSLQSFMDYCNLPNEIVLKSTQYELCIEILQCFESYQSR